MSDFLIRTGTDADLPAIVATYNHYIENEIATFHLTPFTVEERQEWFAAFNSDPRFPLLVAEKAGAIIGHSYATPYRARQAYAASVETTIYLAKDAPRRVGLGTALYTALFEKLEGAGVHRALAGISLPNPNSVGLHHAMGFRDVGVMSEVGHKFDQWIDVLWLEKHF